MKIAIIAAILVILGGGSYGLAQINWSSAFSCPKGQHSYIAGYSYVPVSTGKTVVIIPIPIMACEVS